MPPTAELRKGPINAETMPTVLSQLREMLSDKPFAIFRRDEPKFDPCVLRLDPGRSEPVTSKTTPPGIRIFIAGASHVDILRSYGYDKVSFCFSGPQLEITTVYRGEEHTRVVMSLRAPDFVPEDDVNSGPDQLEEPTSALLRRYHALNGEVTPDSADSYAATLAAMMVGREVLYTTPASDGRLRGFKHLHVKGLWIGSGVDHPRLYIEFEEGDSRRPGVHPYLLRPDSALNWPQTWVKMPKGNEGIIMGEVGLNFSRQSHAYYPLGLSS